MNDLPSRIPRLVPGVAIVLVVLLGAAPADADDTESGLTVSIDNDHHDAVDASKLTYTLRVRDSGGKPHKGLVIAQMLPPSLQPVSASEGGETTPTQVTWHRDLPAGDEIRMTLTAEVDRSHAATAQLTTTACVAVDAASPVAVCASDSDPYRAAPSGIAGSRVAWGAGVLGLGLGAVYVRRRRRSAPI